MALGAPIGRREDNKRRKHEALLAEGLAQFAAQGFEAATVEQIATGAGVARGTFYLYFPDKIALFDALMDRFFAPLQEVFAATAVALDACTDRGQVFTAYVVMAQRVAAIGLVHRDELLVAFREARQPGAAGESLRRRERLLLDIVVAFTAAVKARDLLSVTDPRIACLVVYGAVERLFYEVLTGSDLGDPSTLSTEVVALFGHAMGLVPPPT